MGGQVMLAWGDARSSHRPPPRPSSSRLLVKRRRLNALALARAIGDGSGSSGGSSLRLCGSSPRGRRPAESPRRLQRRHATGARGGRAPARCARGRGVEGRTTARHGRQRARQARGDGSGEHARRVAHKDRGGLAPDVEGQPHAFADLQSGDTEVLRYRNAWLHCSAPSPDLAQGSYVAADACERCAHSPALLDVVRRLRKLSRPWGLVGPRLIVGSDTHNERDFVTLLQALEPWWCPDRYRPLWRVWWVVAFGV